MPIRSSIRADRRDPRPGKEAPINATDIVKGAWKALDDKKGRDIVVVDVRGRSPITDYVMICTGWSAPHLKALASEVQAQVKASGMLIYRKSGTPDCGWMVLDYVDVVIHIFEQDKREYYALESLWEDAPRLTLQDL